MHVRLERRAHGADTVTLAAQVTFDERPMRLSYATRTGALVRIDGAIVGAFDAKHLTCDLPALPGAHDLEVEVELRSLPIADLPSGDGLAWRLMLARASQTPGTLLDARPYEVHASATLIGEVVAFGHAHLDVAWLWTYADSKRKALRTFATAIRQVERGPYSFAQSQPQLYAWVEHADSPLFARVRERIGRGWDASVAAMWVEPDCHVPSGESLLRQLAFGMRYTREVLGARPSVVWLPDTFGFPSTLPLLAVHAGATAFATTKLQWNEHTRWPFPQFLWQSADGSALRAAVIDAYEGEADAARVQRARERKEPLAIGFGDGGGGATDAAIDALAAQVWQPLDAWFAGLVAAELPAYRGELYLETHRGTYTTHRDIKSRNAALERALDAAEEDVAWCVAVRAPASAIASLLTDLRTAWTIVLRNQFHDVIAGTSIGPVYEDVHAEYDRADRIVARVAESARSILPRAQLARGLPPPVAPTRDGAAYVLANEYVRALVADDGTIHELGVLGGPSVVALANGLAAFADRPKAWDAWNIDARYERRRVPIKPQGSAIEDDGVVVRFTIGKRSSATMRVELLAGEPYVRVTLAVNWNESHVLLRVDHRIAVSAREVRFGEPHGSLLRSAYPQTEAERARFEVPAQRYAFVDDGARGCAILALDTYGWNALGLRDGGVRVGMSLLRSPGWPDPKADRGEHRIAYALAPTAGAPPSAVEATWKAYADIERVRLFTCEDPSVLIVATKPADDGNGVILRVRECDGGARSVAVRSGGRMRSVQSVDACERTVAGSVRIEGEDLLFDLPAYALRTIRITY